MQFNILVPEGRNIYRFAKILFLKIEGIMEKIHMDARRVYESVDDKSLS